MIKLKHAFHRAFDALVSRPGNIIYDVAFMVICFVFAYFAAPGVGRDWLFYCAGLFTGFSIFWLLYPRFTAARQREFEADMERITSAAMQRLREQMRSEFPLDESPPNEPGVHTRH